MSDDNETKERKEEGKEKEEDPRDEFGNIKQGCDDDFYLVVEEDSPPLKDGDGYKTLEESLAEMAHNPSKQSRPDVVPGELCGDTTPPREEEPKTPSQAKESQEKDVESFLTSALYHNLKGFNVIRGGVFSKIPPEQITQKDLEETFFIGLRFMDPFIVAKTLKQGFIPKLKADKDVFNHILVQLCARPHPLSLYVFNHFSSAMTVNQGVCTAVCEALFFSNFYNAELFEFLKSNESHLTNTSKYMLMVNMIRNNVRLPSSGVLSIETVLRFNFESIADIIHSLAIQNFDKDALEIFKRCDEKLVLNVFKLVERALCITAPFFVSLLRLHYLTMLVNTTRMPTVDQFETDASRNLLSPYWLETCLARKAAITTVSDELLRAFSKFESAVVKVGNHRERCQARCELKNQVTRELMKERLKKSDLNLREDTKQIFDMLLNFAHRDMMVVFSGQFSDSSVIGDLFMDLRPYFRQSLDLFALTPDSVRVDKFFLKNHPRPSSWISEMRDRSTPQCPSSSSSSSSSSS